ncbi:MAG: hypothetical protein IKU41_07335 [Clostridia bacterium]|nr:hypothetical protein [Clostridia bacterium]
MICPHCKKENMNEYATVCVYCKQEIYQGENADEKVREVIAKENSDKANSTIKILISIVLALAVAVVALAIPKPDKASESTTTTTYSNNESTTFNSQGGIDDSGETTTTYQDNENVFEDSAIHEDVGVDVENIVYEEEKTTIKHISEPKVEYSNPYFSIFSSNEVSFLIKASIVGVEYEQQFSEYGYAVFKMKIEEIRKFENGEEKKVNTFSHPKFPKNQSQNFMVDVNAYDKDGNLLTDGWADGYVYGKSVGDVFDVSHGSYFTQYTSETAKFKVETYNSEKSWYEDVLGYGWDELLEND